MTKYVTNRDTIIFSSKYDEPLDIILISNHTKLIFSDFLNCVINYS